MFALTVLREVIFPWCLVERPCFAASSCQRDREIGAESFVSRQVSSWTNLDSHDRFFLYNWWVAGPTVRHRY